MEEGSSCSIHAPVGRYPSPAGTLWGWFPVDLFQIPRDCQGSGFCGRLGLVFARQCGFGVPRLVTGSVQTTCFLLGLQVVVVGSCLSLRQVGASADPVPGKHGVFPWPMHVNCIFDPVSSSGWLLWLVKPASDGATSGSGEVFGRFFLRRSFGGDGAWRQSANTGSSLVLRGLFVFSLFCEDLSARVAGTTLRSILWGVYICMYALLHLFPYIFI